jgi:hypothetical protein
MAMTRPKMKLTLMVLAHRAILNVTHQPWGHVRKSTSRDMCMIPPRLSLASASSSHIPGRLMSFGRLTLFVPHSYGGTLECTRLAACHGENLMNLLRESKSALRERTRYMFCASSSREYSMNDFRIGMGVRDYAPANSSFYGYPLLYTLDGEVRRGCIFFTFRA